MPSADSKCSLLEKSRQGIYAQPRVAAPCKRTTSRQTRRKPLAQFPAARFACCVWRRLRTLVLKVHFCIGARRALRSAKSMARSLRRSQLQNFSAGLKSGDFAGMCHCPFQRDLVNILALVPRHGQRRCDKLAARQWHINKA